MTMWRMRVEFWIPKATKPHLEYVILSACPLQRWLHDVPECCIIRTLAVFFPFVTGFHTNVLFCFCHLKKFEARTSIILTLRRLMSYIYGAPILDVPRSHTTTQHSR